MSVVDQGIAGRIHYRVINARMAWLFSTTAVAALCAVQPAFAADDQAVEVVQADRRVSFDIPALPLSQALTRFGRQAGLQIAADTDTVARFTTQGIVGTATIRDALRQILLGTGLSFRFTSADSVMVEKPGADGGAITLEPVTVEGSLDRGRFGDAPEEPGGFKAEYQVTATKTPLSINDTPQAITVTTRDSIEARNARDVTSALELTAGITTARAADGGPFAGRGLGGGEGFVLRGDELDGKRDVRIDSVAVSSNIFDLAPFERIEVIKGPNSTLFGQGALGGFINMVRKKPKAEFESSVTALTGSFDTRRVEGDVTGPLNEENSLRGRLTVAYDDSGAFIDHVETRTAVFAPSLEARIDDQTRALFQFLYQDDEYTPSRGIPLRREGNELKIPNVSRSLFAGVPSQEKSNAQNALATLRVDHELSDGWLATLSLQGGGQNRERFFDSYANAGYLDTSGNVYIYSDRSATEDLNFAGEVRLDGRFDALGREHQVLVGFEHNNRQTDLAFGYTYLGTGNLYTGDFAAGSVLPGGAGSQPFDFDISTTSRNTAPYAQLILNPLDRTKITLGGRLDFSRIERTNNISGAIDKKRDDAFTFRVGLSQQLTEDITGYAMYGESFEPSVDARSSSGGILKPVTGQGYEVGLKTEWFDGGLGANIAAFQQDLDNVPITDPDDNNFQINGGLRRTKGIEVEVAGSPMPGLTAGFASSYLYTKFIDVRDDNFNLTPDGAETQTTLYGHYELQSGSLQGLGFGASLISVGDRLLLDDGFNSFVEGYERVDVSLSYRGIEGVDLSLQVRNLLDERYIERVRDRYQDNFFGSPRAFLLRGKMAL